MSNEFHAPSIAFRNRPVWLPSCGAGGGWVVAVGTPEDVAAHEGSHTGRFLKAMLGA